MIAVKIVCIWTRILTFAFAILGNFFFVFNIVYNHSSQLHQTLAFVLAAGQNLVSGKQPVATWRELLMNLNIKGIKVVHV